MSARPVADLVVDWTACRAHGLCLELLPGRLEADDWGYPVVAGGVPEDEVAHGHHAVRACPNLALRLIPRRDG